MPDEALAEAEDFEADFEDLVPSRRFSGKKLVLFIVLPLLLLGGGAGVMYGGMLSDAEKKDQNHAGSEAAHGPQTIFYELPEILVNLNSTSRRPSYLKIKVSLEIVGESNIQRLDVLKPRIIDNFQVYLRELRIDDLRGSAGIYRLREELLARVNMAVHPVRVKNVLFKEILVQ